MLAFVVVEVKPTETCRACTAGEDLAVGIDIRAHNARASTDDVSLIATHAPARVRVIILTKGIGHHALPISA